MVIFFGCQLQKLPVKMMGMTGSSLGPAYRAIEHVSTEPFSATATLKPGISFLWKQPHITFSSGK